MTKQVQYWARYDVDFHSVIYELWDVLDNEVPDTYVKENNPHITVHPRFQFDVGKEKEFEHYVYENFPQTIEIRINGFHYHPDKYKPMVICLDTDTNIDFRSGQRTLEQSISRNGGKNVLDPVAPHITVYKSKDKGAGQRRIPSNVNQIKTRCEKLGSDIFPMKIGETQLVVEKAPHY